MNRIFVGLMASLFALLFTMPAAARGACLPIAGDHIFGRDLAAAESRFSALPATLTVGFPPAPGTHRVFTTEELARIARTNGLVFVPDANICFELAMRVVTAEAALTAMRRALAPDAQVRIVELQAASVPEGTLEFPPAGLEPAARDSDIRVWRGFVLYAGTRREPVWVRVTISGAIRVASLSSGRLTDRSAAANPDMRRGDAVRVEVECGMAHLALDAVAVENGHTGAMVALRNPGTGRTFQAKLLTPSTARLVLAPGQTF